MMARPAIIIGLGGTGQWVLTYLKKNLLEENGGVIPPEVKLLCFDTTLRSSVYAGKSSRLNELYEDIHIGSINVTEGKEFIPIGNDVFNLVNEIGAGKHSHLQWFPAKYFLSNMPRAAYNLQEGSGRFRHLGRIALFQDLAIRHVSKILSHLQSSIWEIQREISSDKQLEIIIVGSLAGGTGSGMLVDIALWVRHIAQQMSTRFIVRGFFVLPRPFMENGMGENHDMLARSFATWRELDRFMLSSGPFEQNIVNYNESDPNFRIHSSQRLYDLCYMVDSSRESNSLSTVRPEDGVFPLIANTISFVIDSEKKGRRYIEDVTNNLAINLANLPRKSYYSAIGSYTLKIPVYYIQEMLSYQLALDVLKEFLALETNGKNSFPIVSDSNNREAPANQKGYEAAINFMQSIGLFMDGRTIPNTRFMNFIAEVSEKDRLLDQGYLHMIARGLSDENSNFLKAFTDISQDEEGKRILLDSSPELNKLIWQKVIPSRDYFDTPDVALERIKTGVSQFVQENYGINFTGGEQFGGRYGNALEQIKIVQVMRFKKLLQAWTLQTLNGSSFNSLVARGGKIGYVRSFYSGLLGVFDYFIKALNDIRKIRIEEGIDTKYRLDAEQAFIEYKALGTKKCWLTFWDNFTHPDAHKSQRNYLLAEQRYINARKEEIILDKIAAAIKEMRNITSKGLEDIQSWIVCLAFGDPRTNGKSLYSELLESFQDIIEGQKMDRRLERISKLIGEREYKIDEADLLEMLGHIKWEINEFSDGFRITCGIDLPTEENNQLTSFSPFFLEGQKIKENLKLIIKLSKRQYYNIPQEYLLAKELQNEYPSPVLLVDAIDKKADPLFAPAYSSQKSAVASYYYRIHYDDDNLSTKYFADFEKEIEKRNPYIRDNSFVHFDSEYYHRMTIVRSDDLIPSEDFQVWRDCRGAYIQQVTQPQHGTPSAELLHIFPAEINACSYETEISRLLGKKYRILRPDTVALLEDKERFELFFIAYALGFIKLTNEKGESNWKYQLPEDKEGFYLFESRNFSNKNFQLSICEVISNFLTGADRITIKFIDWKKLKDTIISTREAFGKEKLVNLYKKQIDHPEGIISLLQSEKQGRKVSVYEGGFESGFGQESDDLVDIAQVIYLRAIVSLENMPAENVNLVDFASNSEFKIVKTSSADIFELVPEANKYGAWFNKSVLACQVSKSLNIPVVLNLVSQIETIKKGGKEFEDVVFVACEKEVSEEVIQLFMRIRAEKGIRFVSIDKELVQGTLLSKVLIDILGPQRDLFDRRIPVSDPLNFFGREAIVKDLQIRLQNREAIGLFGLRKIGKSSLLQYLRSVSNFPLAHVDLQAGADCLGIFARALTSWGETTRNLKILWISDTGNTKDIITKFGEAVSRLSASSQAEGKGVPALLVDEIELILPKSNNDESTQNFLIFSRMLRGLIQEGHLGLILAGVDAGINHENRFGSEQNPFYQFLYEQYLGPISSKDCAEMITAIGSQMLLSYSPTALDRVVQASGGHPFIARQICSAVYKSLPPGKQNISIEDIENTLRKFISQSTTSNFLNNQGLWGEITNIKLWQPELINEYKRILLMLSKNHSLVEDELLKSSVNLSFGERAVQELERRGVLKNINGTYTIGFEIFRDWICRYELDNLD